MSLLESRNAQRALAIALALVIVLLSLLILPKQALALDSGQGLLHMSAASEGQNALLQQAQTVMSQTPLSIVVTPDNATGLDQLGLEITTPQGLFKYTGSLSGQIPFTPSQDGLYLLALRSKRTNEVLDRLSFRVGVLLQPPAQVNVASPNGSSRNGSNASVAGAMAGAMAGGSGASNSSQGNSSQNNSLAVEHPGSFVSGPAPGAHRILQATPQNLTLGETVFIRVAGLEDSDILQIEAGGNVYRYLGDMSSAISFVPTLPGDERISIVDPQSDVFAQVQIHVFPQPLENTPLVANGSNGFNASNGSSGSGGEGITGAAIGSGGIGENASGNSSGNSSGYAQGQGNGANASIGVSLQAPLWQQAQGPISLASIMQYRALSFSKMRDAVASDYSVGDDERMRRLQVKDEQAHVEEQLQLAGVQDIPLWIHDSTGSLLNAQISIESESGAAPIAPLQSSQPSAQAPSPQAPPQAPAGTLPLDQVIQGNGGLQPVSGVENVTNAANGSNESSGLNKSSGLNGSSGLNASIAQAAAQSPVPGAASGAVPAAVPSGWQDTVSAQELNLTSVQGPRRLRIRPKTSPIQEVSLDGVALSAPLKLGLEEVFSIKTPGELTAKNRSFVQGFAIDPTAMNFTGGQVTVQAEGKELYKCLAWDFAGQDCLGNWTKIMDIVPGENYTINITGQDPGFGEAVAIPKNGWVWWSGSIMVGVYLCQDFACTNTSTNFAPGDTVYMLINTSTQDLRQNSVNNIDVYQGGDTTSIQNLQWSCTPAPSPYNRCIANFTIDDQWPDGWYYIDSDLDGTGGGSHYQFETPFTVNVNDLSFSDDSLKFFVDAGFTREADAFPEGGTVYVQFNLTGNTQTITGNTAPRIMTFQAGATNTAETIINATSPFRISFVFPNLRNDYWYWWQPRLRNSTGGAAGAVPEGAEIYGRMIWDRSNTAPVIVRAFSNSNYSSQLSVGQPITYTVNFTDVDETNYHVIFICSNASATVTGCMNQTICTQSMWMLDIPQNCTRNALRSDRQNVTSYAFVCDPFACSAATQLNWSVFNDSAGPTISLQNPLNNINPGNPLPYLNSLAVQFDYIPTDNYGLANCSLYTNASGGFALTLTNYSINNTNMNSFLYTFPSDGAYKWNVRCYDYAGNSNWSSLNFTFAIHGPPIVSLMSPSDGIFLSTLNPIFTYNVTYRNNVSNCSLFINTDMNATNDTVKLGSPQNITIPFGQDTAFNWSVQCVDNESFTGTSDNQTLILDTTAPVVNLMAPGNNSVQNSTVLTFSFNVSEVSNVSNCTLFIDSSPYDDFPDTISLTEIDGVEILANGLYPWYVQCADLAGNVGTSGTFMLNVSSNETSVPFWYETNFKNLNYTTTADVNLSFKVDGTPNTIIHGISGGSPYVMSHAVSSYLGANGILIKPNQLVNFSGVFRKSGGGGTDYASWHILRVNGTSKSEMCAFGNDNTGGIGFGSTAGDVTRLGRCNIPAQTRITATEQIGLKVTVYNAAGGVRTIRHVIDSLNSWTYFNFTRLGFLSVTLQNPAGPLYIKQNETFPLVCQYKCTQGSCINVSIYAQYNSTLPGTVQYTNVSLGAGNLVLNASQTNPHNFTIVAQGTYNTTFWIKGANYSFNYVRCVATSDYTTPSTSASQPVNVSDNSAPSVTLISPQDYAYLPGNATFIFLPVDNSGIANCSLIIGGIVNKTNASIQNNVYNNFTVNNFGEGNYNWSVNCTDLQGNQGASALRRFTIDMTPPSVNLTMPPNGSNWTTSTITFNFTANDTVSTMLKCNLTLDGNVSGPNLAVTGGVPFKLVIGNLSIATHYWNVSCIDNATNRNTTATWWFNITNLPPVVALVGPNDSFWSNIPRVNLTYNYTDNGPARNCSLFLNNAFNMTNQSAVVNGRISNFTLANLADGVYVWNVTCTDAGSGSGLSASGINRTFFVDTQAPAINLIYPNETLNYFTILFNFTATDNLARSLNCTILIDNVVRAPYVFAQNGTMKSTSIGPIANGNHTWNVTCMDNASNVNRSVNMNFTVFAPPIVRIVFPGNNAYNNTGNITLVYNVTSPNPVSNCTLLLNGAFNMTNQTPILNGLSNNFNLSNLTEGTYNWSALCFDTQGFAGNSSQQNFTIDRTKPYINLTYPLQNTVVHTSIVPFNFTVTDNIDLVIGCDFYVDGGVKFSNIQVPSGSNFNETWALADGAHTWKVVCTDDAGNHNTSATLSFNVSGPPQVSLLSPGNGSWVNTLAVNLSYRPYQSTGLANCSLFFDSAYNQSSTSISNNNPNNFTVSAVSSGPHNWSVFCIDNSAGNTTSGWYSFVVDVTPPSILLVSPLQNETYASNWVNFTFIPTDNSGVNMTCNVSANGTFVAGPLSVSNNSVANSTELLHGGGAVYKWNVTCYDAALNFNTSVTQNFTLIAPPSVLLISPGDLSTNGGFVNFSYRPSDPFNLSNCSLVVNGVYNQTNFTIRNSQVNNFSLVNMTQGTYYWNVTCTDVDGDSFMTAPRSFQVNTVPPNIALIAPPSQTAVPFVNPAVEFNWSVTDDNSTGINCSVGVDSVTRTGLIPLGNPGVGNATVTGFGDGVHGWNVTCYDQSGNFNTSYSWYFNMSIIPSILQSAPGNASWNNTGGQSFLFTPTDNDGIANCSIWLNGVFANSSASMANASQNQINVSGLSDGYYLWSVLCIDSGPLQNSNMSANLSFWEDQTPPSVVLYQPTPDQPFTVNAVNFNWSVTDNLAPNATCNLTLDQASPFPLLALNNGTWLNRSLTGIVNGVHYWNVSCVDLAGNRNTSVTLNFTVQQVPQIALQLPANNTLWNSSTLAFNYTPRSNSNAFANCSLIIDGAVWATNYTINNSMPNTIVGTGISDGSHTWNVNCTDSTLNFAANDSSLLFVVDTVAPNIQQNAPAPNANILFSSVNFNWTAYDYLSANLTCNLTIDMSVNALAANVKVQNATPYNITINNFASGPHNWSVTCWDWVNNTNTTATLNFTIPPIDFELNQSYLSVSNTNPDPLSNISINATVFNVGGGAPVNITVAFWDGKPYVGTFIANRTIALLPGGANQTVSTSWNITLGFHQLWVAVDPNGIYSDTNKLNDNASINISTLFANITSPSNFTWTPNVSTVFQFLVANFTGGTLNYSFYVDGVQNASANVADNATQSVSIPFAEGKHAIILEAQDGVLSRRKNSTQIDLYVDLNPPIPSILTINQSWFNVANPLISLRVTDTLDPLLNYTFYANSVANVQGNTTNGTTVSAALSPGLVNGTYILVLEAHDRVLHYANSSPITIFIDTVVPFIALNAPPPSYSLFGLRNISFNWSVSDNMAASLMCNLSVDGTSRAQIGVQNGTAANYTIGGFSEGLHVWNVTCFDNATNFNTTATRNFSIFISPNITLTNPANNTWSANATTVFFFNITEETGITNCSIFLNNSLAQTKTGSQLAWISAQSVQDNFTIASLNGTYDWKVECYDNTSAFMSANTTAYRLWVDLNPPVPIILTANNTAFNTSTPRIAINITDNRAPNVSFTFYANGAANAQGFVNSSILSNQTLTSLADGYYWLVLEGMDLARNAANSTPIRILIDTQGPNIQLLEPPNGNITTGNTIRFNFTANDTFSQNLTCNVSISGFGYVDINTTSGAMVNFTRIMSAGVHYWNATCIDQLGNANTSATFNFSVPMPDLAVNATDIHFSANNPKEGENITINATFYNLGSIPAYNFTFAFYLGDPQNGSMILPNATFSVLNQGSSATVAVNWSAVIGQNTICVMADPPLPTGSVVESNESNNIACQLITVGSWHFVGGTVSGAIDLANVGNFSVYDWNVENYSNSSLYVAKDGASISWLTLKALSRNATNAYRPHDFETLDTKFNMTGAIDSINTTYTSSALPIYARNYTLYGRFVNDIPVANSTNESSFLTGILWDAADGNTSYNGSQDVVFMTKFNPGKTGFNGTFDYEIRIPAKLRSYNGAGTTVDFYLELR